MSTLLQTAAPLGHPLGVSRIAFYSAVAVVNTFIIGGVVFNFGTENSIRPESKGDRRLFAVSILFLVASETLALGALYHGRDTRGIGFASQLLLTLGAWIFFSSLAARIVDPKGIAFETMNGKKGRQVGAYVFLFGLSILVPLFFLNGLG